MGDVLLGISQNVEEILNRESSKSMIANSEVLLILNQSPTDRTKLRKELNFAESELSYITNAEAGTGLIKAKNAIIPFTNQFPKDTELYKLMTTKLDEIKE